jgi:putative DNA primase/helicase
MPSDTLSAADGRWPSILQDLGGLHPDQMEDRHQPCPNCGGTDRYRWDGDDGPGSWFCSHCGGRDGKGGGGTGIGLLMRVRNWTFKEAARAVEQHLGITPGTPSRRAPSAAPAAAPRKPKRPARIPDKPPVDAPPPALDGATHQWCYRNAAGEQLFWIQRVTRPGTDSKGKPNKIYVHRTWINSAWHRPSKRDAFTSEWPSPRPLYRLEQLQLHPESGVLLTEGEKSADAAQRFFPQAVCLSWPNGGKAIKHVDWTPLAGRSITLWPDNDDEGRQAMASLATLLLQSGAAKVAIVTPPPDRPPGWDLADASDWSSADANAWVRQHRSAPITLPEPPAPPTEPEPPSQEPPAAVREVPTDRPFECLGFDIDGFYYQPHRTGQVVRLARSSHTGTNLVALAPISYWESVYPSKTGANWTAAASSLFIDQAAVGIFSTDSIRGRGAWWDAGRSVLHLGDRLLIDGIEQPISKAAKSRFYYQRLAPIDLPPGIQPLPDDLGMEIIDIASRFHWEVPASGLLMAGWIALAPICGALQWRPHVWLTASAGSGKSAILDRFIGPLLESLALFPEGNTTEAFIRQQLRADAIPVIFDEAESNEKSDRQRIQNILSLARVASSSGRGVIGKGGADGTAQSFTIRSMFLLCSISTALKQGADQSRFAQLTLRNPSFMPKAERIAHWSDLDADITRICTSEVGHQLLLRMVWQIPIIRDSVAVFRRAAAERFDSQRQGDQYGTLLAGAWSLANSRPATIEDAYQLIDSNNWDAYREQTEADEERCLQHILQHQLRIEIERIEVVGGKVFNRASATTRTVWELVEAMGGTSESKDISADSAEPHLGRIGIRVVDGRLLIANTALGLQRILADTPWAQCWPTVLARLPGATKAGKVRFKGMSNSSRAVSIPLPKD